ERPIHGKPPDGNMPEGSTSEDSTQTTRAASSPCSIHCAVHEESDTAIGREYWNLHSIGGQQICRSGRACSPSGQSLGGARDRAPIQPRRGLVADDCIAG